MGAGGFIVPDGEKIPLLHWIGHETVHGSRNTRPDRGWSSLWGPRRAWRDLLAEGVLCGCIGRAIEGSGPRYRLSAHTIRECFLTHYRDYRATFFLSVGETVGIEFV